jgi:hypothetical protein
MVKQTLPDDPVFEIAPNSSFDGNPLQGDEAVFPQDTLPPGQTLGPLDANSAADWLWRGGKIPEWIDVRVYGACPASSILRLECCGRFTSSAELLYHERERNQPFHVTSPTLPPGWRSVELHGRFDLEANRRPLAGEQADEADDPAAGAS